MKGKNKVRIIDGLGDGRDFPIPEGVHLLGEEDFQAAMDGAGRKWREECVREGDFLSYDGTRIRYYDAVPEKCRASISILHGFCEFWGKYHELAWYFYQAGYAVFFMEQRGHGYSGRKIPEEDLVHIDSYEEYVEDFRCFINVVVRKNSSGLPLYLFAHSMGGAVGALFLEKYPGVFRKAVLSSPMLKMKTGKYPKAAVMALAVHVKLHGMEHELSAGQHRFDGKPVFETSSTLSKPRYDYLFEQRLADSHYTTYGATFGWVIASLEANRKLLRNAHRVRIPVLLFQAGEDHLVDPSGHLEFAKKSGKTTIVRYEHSRHEIFNATEDIRRNYYGRIFAFYG